MSKISRYRAGSSPEEEWEPGSRKRVMRNLLGVTSKREMDRVEAKALARMEIRYHDIITSQTHFTCDLIRQMHTDWLGGIYAWAGHYREVELSKGGFRWPPARFVSQNMEAFAAGLLSEHTPCPPSKPREVAQRLAVVHAEFLLIHPFRDGNGRTARWIANLMTEQAGLRAPAYDFDRRGGEARRLQYLNAVKRGYATDFNPLVEFFVDALSRSAASAH